METAVRISPGSSDLRWGDRAIPVYTLWLGGIPRGAVLLLLDGGSAEFDAADAMNVLATHGYESIAAVPPADLDDDSCTTLVDTLTVRLGERGWAGEQIGVLGLGTSGRAALIAALTDAFGAAVSVAPAGRPPTSPRKHRTGADLRTPWLGLLGAQDLFSAGGVLADLLPPLEAESPVHRELVRYDGVDGDFFRDSPRPSVHAAAFDSWQRIIEWLDAMVVPRPTPLAVAWRMRTAGSTRGVSRRHEGMEQP